MFYLFGSIYFWAFYIWYYKFFLIEIISSRKNCDFCKYSFTEFAQFFWSLRFLYIVPTKIISFPSPIWMPYFSCLHLARPLNTTLSRSSKIVGILVLFLNFGGKAFKSWQYVVSCGLVIYWLMLCWGRFPVHLLWDFWILSNAFSVLFFYP